MESRIAHLSSGSFKDSNQASNHGIRKRTIEKNFKAEKIGQDTLDFGTGSYHPNCRGN